MKWIISNKAEGLHDAVVGRWVLIEVNKTLKQIACHPVSYLVVFFHYDQAMNIRKYKDISQREALVSERIVSNSVAKIQWSSDAPASRIIFQ